MKKIIALVIAILMMAAIAVPAFAGTYDPEGENTVTVTYKVEGDYTVTIIDAVILGTTGEQTVSVSDAVIAENKSLKVSVESANDFTVVCGTNSIAYEMTYGENTADTESADGAVEILSVASGTATGSVAVSFELTGTAPANVAGEFVDTLTFEVAVA